MARPTNNNNLSLDEAINTITKEELLSKYNLNISLKVLADSLHLSRATLYNLLKYYDINYRENIQAQSAINTLNNIDKNEFESFLLKFGKVKTWQKFKIGRKSFYLFCKLHNIDPNSTNAMATTCREKIENKINAIGKDTIENAIINLGYVGALQELNISRTTLDYYIKTYNPKIMQRTKNHNSNNSFYNIKLQTIFEKNNINFEREFNVNKKRFDFKIENILIDIDPCRTHNLDGDNTRYRALPFYYHQKKSLLALTSGYYIKHLYQWNRLSLEELHDSMIAFDFKDNNIIINLYGKINYEELKNKILLLPINSNITLYNSLDFCTIFFKNKNYFLTEPKIHYYDKKENREITNSKLYTNIYRVADAGLIYWKFTREELLEELDKYALCKNK